MFTSHIWNYIYICDPLPGIKYSTSESLLRARYQGKKCSQISTQVWNKPHLQGAHLGPPSPQSFPSSSPWYNPYFSSPLAHEHLQGMNCGAQNLVQSRWSMYLMKERWSPKLPITNRPTLEDGQSPRQVWQMGSHHFTPLQYVLPLYSHCPISDPNDYFLGPWPMLPYWAPALGPSHPPTPCQSSWSPPRSVHFTLFRSLFPTTLDRKGCFHR